MLDAQWLEHQRPAGREHEVGGGQLVHPRAEGPHEAGAQDRRAIAEVSRHLKELGERLEALSRRADLSETAVLLESMIEIKSASARIRETHGATNKNGTFPREIKGR